MRLIAGREGRGTGSVARSERIWARAGELKTNALDTLSVGDQARLPSDALIKLEVGLRLLEELPVRHRLGSIAPGGRSVCRSARTLDASAMCNLSFVASTMRCTVAIYICGVHVGFGSEAALPRSEPVSSSPRFPPSRLIRRLPPAAITGTARPNRPVQRLRSRTPLGGKHQINLNKSGHGTPAYRLSCADRQRLFARRAGYVTPPP